MYETDVEEMMTDTEEEIKDDFEEDQENIPPPPTKKAPAKKGAAKGKGKNWIILWQVVTQDFIFYLFFYYFSRDSIFYVCVTSCKNKYGLFHLN